MLPRMDKNTSEPFWFVIIHFHEYMLAIDATENELVQRINEFMERLENDEEVRIEYRAPYFFKVRKFMPKPRKVVNIPRILPAAVTTNKPADDAAELID